MKCPACHNDLAKQKLDTFDIAACEVCKGLWIDSFTFSELTTYESPFSELLKIDLWEDVKKHKVAPSDKKCPVCDKNLYKAEYADSGVVLEICPYCRSIWFDRGELEKIIGHIDRKISDETLDSLFNELGEELKEFLVGQEPFSSEIRQIGLLIKLLEYKVFSRFRILQDIANSLPL